MVPRRFRNSRLRMATFSEALFHFGRGLCPARMLHGSFCSTVEERIYSNTKAKRPGITEPFQGRRVSGRIQSFVLHHDPDGSVEPPSYELGSARQSDNLRSRAVVGEHRRHCCSTHLTRDTSVLRCFVSNPVLSGSPGPGSCGFMLGGLLELLAHRTVQAAFLTKDG